MRIHKVKCNATKEYEYHLIFIMQMMENITKLKRFMKNIKSAKNSLRNFI